MKTKLLQFSPAKLEQAVKIDLEWSWAKLAFELSKASDRQVSEQRIYAWRRGVEPSGQIVALLADVTGKPMEYYYEEIKVKGAKA